MREGKTKTDRQTNRYTDGQTETERKRDTKRGRERIGQTNRSRERAAVGHLSLYDIQKKVRFPATTEKLAKS